MHPLLNPKQPVPPTTPTSRTQAFFFKIIYGGAGAVMFLIPAAPKAVQDGPSP